MELMALRNISVTYFLLMKHKTFRHGMVFCIIIEMKTKLDYKISLEHHYSIWTDEGLG